MKYQHPYIILFCFLLSIAASGSGTGDKKLFSILENGKYGFINAKGKVVIPVQFFYVDNFSEGLANVRQTGRYGYIDSSGSFVIKAIYDFAEPFSDGLAIVYEDGKPNVIDRMGNPKFASHYEAISGFKKSRALVRVGTKNSENYGVIDRTGKLIADTIYESIHLLDNGNMILTQRDYFKSPRSNHNSSALADSNGKLICPFGIYESMKVDRDYFSVSIPARPDDTIEGYSAREGLSDARGRLIYSRDYTDGFIGNTWSEGFVSISFGRPHDRGQYYGYIDTNGKVMKSYEYDRAYDFSCGRAFVVTPKFKYIMLDKKGKKIGREYDEVKGESFYSGYALVSVAGKYGVIDTNGRFVVQPSFPIVSEKVLDGRYFFFSNSPVGDRNTKPRFGIYTVSGRILLPELMTDYSSGGFNGGLLECVIDDKLTYIDTMGQIVWQNPSKVMQPYTSLNTEVMQRGHYYAYSSPIATHERSGGSATSRNIPKPVDAGQHFEANKLSILVRPDMPDTFAGTYRGLKTFIANTSKDTMYFNAQDSRLYMKVQALAPDGEWKDIEYLPSSWCGNSSHVVSLNPGYYWSFVTPEYDGDYKTKLRVEVEYINAGTGSINPDSRTIKLYSNEFDAGINPSQFWLKNTYTPQGIMDPYYD